MRHRALVVLLVLGLALVAPHAPWSGLPRAESDRAAISRSGVLGGASYLIEVPAKWQGGLVVFAHGIQRGSGPGAGSAEMHEICGQADDLGRSATAVR